MGKFWVKGLFLEKVTKSDKFIKNAVENVVEYSGSTTANDVATIINDD